MEKNYILFSTNESKAINNVSIIIATDEPITKASKMLGDACKYNNYTISPVGAPIGGKVHTLEESVKILASTKLVKKGWKHINDTLEVINDLPDMVRYDRDSDCPDTIVLSLRTSFVAGNTELFELEQSIVQSLRKRFTNLAYHKYRSSFILGAERHETKNTLKLVSYGIVSNELVKLTRNYKSTTIEI